MNNTKKLNDYKNTKMIAHMGLSGLEPKNTIAAFIAAGNRSYFGIETDLHVTKDGKFIVTHDDNTLRATGVSMIVEETDFETLRALNVFDSDEKSYRSDLHFPSLSEYIGICKKYGKIAVLELKNQFKEEDVYAICEEIETLDYMSGTIFISFAIDNLHFVRKKYPEQPVQFLLGKEIPENLPELLKRYAFDLDIYYKAITPELINAVHAVGAKVNAWTVDDPEVAERLISYGIDFITSNIIE